MTRRRALLAAAALLLGAAAHPLHQLAPAARARAPVAWLAASNASFDRFADAPQEASRFRSRPLPPPAAPAAAAVTVTRPVTGTVTVTKPPAVTNPATVGAWACVGRRESGNDYRKNTGNGYYGRVQWLRSTWNAAMRLLGVDYAKYANGRADLAPPDVQDTAAVAWQTVHGWGQWPQTSRACGLR